MNKNELELSVLKSINTPSVGFSVAMNLGNRFLINDKQVSESEFNEYLKHTPDLIPIRLNLGKEL